MSNETRTQAPDATVEPNKRCGNCAWGQSRMRWSGTESLESYVVCLNGKSRAFGASLNAYAVCDHWQRRGAE